MIKFLATACSALVLITSGMATEPIARVVEITEDDFLRIEVCDGGVIGDNLVHIYDINYPKEIIYIGDKVPVTKCEGRFYHKLDAENYKGDMETLYQFRSDDNTVWWLLTESEIGEVPNYDDKYTLYFSENNTTEFDYQCGCADKSDCECYLYDDMFLCIKRCSDNGGF